jgi:hypothetical protein
MRQRSQKPTASVGKPVFIEVAPNAARTMSAMREMGYDSFAAVMDLVDNSIDAGGKTIDVSIRELSKGSLVIDIVDDGKGMDAKTLTEALKLGSKVEHADPSKRLGKYGMGLVTASISMARNVWVLTRVADKTAVETTFDLDTIDRENRFVITQPKAAEGRRVTEVFGMDGHGTLVRLSKIDRINDTNVSRFAGNLRTILGQTYRHFLALGVKLSVNGRRVQRYDPLMLDHPQTEVVLDTTLDLGDGTKATLKVVELPDLGQIGDAEANIFPHNSGFYVVRNNREIIAGETFGFYRHHHSYSHFRAELAYHGSSSVFHEDIKKSSIHPDDRLREKLNKLTKSLIENSGRSGRERGEDRPVQIGGKMADLINAKLAGPSDKNGDEKKASKKDDAKQPPQVEFASVAVEEGGRMFHAEPKDGKFVVYYNSKHPLVRMAAENKHLRASSLLDMIAFAFSKAEGESRGDAGKLMEKAGNYLAMLATQDAEAK